MASANSGLGGPAGYGEGVFTTAVKNVGDNDDGAVTVDVTSVFGNAGLKFFDNSYTELHINSNGVISFGSPDTSYSGSDLSDLPQPSIAVFWADHIIGGGGEIYWDVDPSSGKITITWHDVASYSGSGENTYQIVLQDTGSGNLNVEFIYEDIGWFQSGGTSAVAGITDGNTTHIPLDGSGGSNELNQYESNDFGGGDEVGTYKVPFIDGVPQLQNNVVEGTSGDDTFLESGADLQGDAITSGADNVQTGAGDDLVEAGDGDDTVHGGSGSDTIEGGAGADEIHGDGILGDAPPTSTTIDASNFFDTSSGFQVSARNIESGTLSAASTDNVTSAMGGFGASGTISDTDSGVYEQTGFDLASGVSEQLIVDFDAPIEDASFSFIALFTADYGEEAQWAIYNDGALVAQSAFTEDSSGSGSGTINLSGYGPFNQIVFTGLPQTDGTDGSDFFIQNITFETPVPAAAYDDSIQGGDGVDAIYGGLGSDVISGDGGDDTLFGEDGNDDIQGGLGNDSVLGGAGDDSISGGEGDDYIEGGEGDDSLSTGLGEDTLMGGAGNDTLRNSDGDDSLDGGSGDDLIIASGGEDTLRGGSGADTMEGGNDADTFIIENGFGNDSIIGGEGTTDVTDIDYDVIDLSAVTSGPVTVQYTGNEEGWITDGADTLVFSEIESLILTDQADLVFGQNDSVGLDIDLGGGNDTMTDGDGDDSIQGGSGNDYIAGNLGNDTIEGGAGNDDIEGGDEADSIDGGAGDDFLAGYDVNGLASHSTLAVSDDGSDDTLVGGDGQDTLLGGAGDDSLDGGDGNDSLTGGDGDDVFTYNAGDGSDTITDFNFGNTGTINDGDSSNNDFIDLSQYYDNLSELYADQADDGILNQSNTTDSGGLATDYSDNAQFASGEGITFQGASADNTSFTAENTAVVCFTTGTAIRTPKGSLRIEDLRVGDLVSTLDNGPQPIHWIGMTHLGAEALARSPRSRPILIKRGVMDNARDLLVSPQHGMLWRGDHLVRAKHLAQKMPGIRVALGRRQVTYVHLMLESHQILFAENSPTESFYPGPMALRILSAKSRDTLFRAMPHLPLLPATDSPAQYYGPAARPFLSKHKITAFCETMQVRCDFA